MALPLRYNLRNLWVRKTTTLMTALGIGLTVAVLLSILALVNSLAEAFRATGNPRHVLVMRKGSDAELSSAVARDQFQEMKFTPGIARDAKGDPLISPEMLAIINLPSVDNPDGSNITVRGITPAGIALRDGLRLAAGRWFETGKREIVAGKSIAARFPDARIGNSVRFIGGGWRIVGVLDAGRSAANSEIWADLNQVAADFGRTQSFSSVLIRATDEVAAAALINRLANDQRFNVSARSEVDYYESQTSSGRLVEFLGLFVCAIMAVGSGFAAANTMYAAVARRAREIGTLRVLGFSRGSILLGFLAESVFLSAAGGLIGILLVLPLNGATTGISNFVTFSEIAFDFRITPSIMAAGMVFAVLLGAAGGLFPARNAARKEILNALREI